MRACFALLSVLVIGCGSGGGLDDGGGSSPGPGGGDSTPGVDGGAPADPNLDGGRGVVGGDLAMPPAQPAPCAPGQGDHFTCEAGNARRVRCIDNTLRAVDCDSRGCVAGAANTSGEASCSCGADGSFSRWNCTADGNLHSCAGGITWLTQSCGGRGCTAAPVGVSDRCNAAPGTLQAKLDRLGALCGQYSPGTTCGLAVRDFMTGEEAHSGGNVFYVSASSAKAIWVAAALYDTSIAAVMPYSYPVFHDSDNSASGRVIDLLSSPDRLNTFQWNDVGLPDTGFCNWSFDKTRHATNCPDVKGGDNFFTADDMLRFVTALWDRSILADAKAQAELQWMQLSPRSGYGGWLGTQLPAAAQQSMHHKAGWLPPVEVPGYSNSNEIGIVEIPSGHVYGVAILMSGAPDQASYDGKQLPTMEFASCVIYHSVAGDADPFASCTHP